MKSVRVEREHGDLVLDFELFLPAACHEHSLNSQDNYQNREPRKNTCTYAKCEMKMLIE